MAFREVTMLEVKEILRLWLLGVPKRQIASQLGFDVKTVRRYLAAAKAGGVEQTHGLGALSDELVAAVVAATQPATGRPRGDGWAVCEAHREFIAGHLTHHVRLTKIGKLLLRRGVVIEYPTLRRFALAELDFGRGAPSVPVADCDPGAELQVDTGWMTLLEPDLFGKRRRFKAWIFTAVYSRHRFVFPIFHETTESAIQACEAAWDFFGGVFRVLMPDYVARHVIGVLCPVPLRGRGRMMVGGSGSRSRSRPHNCQSDPSQDSSASSFRQTGARGNASEVPLDGSHTRSAASLARTLISA